MPETHPSQIKSGSWGIWGWAGQRGDSGRLWVGIYCSPRAGHCWAKVLRLGDVSVPEV